VNGSSALDPTRVRRSWRDADWIKVPTLVTGVALVCAVLLAAVAAPLITGHDPLAQDLTSILQGPSSAHWLGTDQLGRDYFARLVFAARVDLRIGVVAVTFAFIVGSVLGSIAGYFGGFVDSLIMRISDIVAAIPVTVLVIALVFVLGQGELSIYVAFTIIGWVAYARIVRAEVVVAKAQDYVIAARVAGLSPRRVLTRHVLPNAVTQAITFAMTDVVNVMLAIVVLGFLGLGIAPPTPEWGAMMSDGQALLQTRWQLATLPGLAVLITGLGFALTGDGLADLLRRK
jgi:peptide/nickel transport system permease protein